MTILKTACFAIAATSILALPSAAYANSDSIYNGGQASISVAIDGNLGGRHNTLSTTDGKGHTSIYVLGASSTASFYYRKGVRNFKKGNLEKSESAFEASLRAHGSRSMDGLTLHYLTLISDKQGDEVQKKKYAQAYYKLTEK